MQSTNQGYLSSENRDYPDYGKAVGERVLQKQADLGAPVCGSGIGIFHRRKQSPAFARSGS